MARCLNCIHFDVCDSDRRDMERSYGDCSDFLHDDDVSPKTEVAREIFDEIQKMVNRYWLDNDYGMPDMETELTKLKKKYTEDQT